MASCPHCSADIESLPGFVPQGKHEQRLNAQREAKDAEIHALSAEVTTLRAQASGFDAVSAERDRFRTELEGMRTAAARKEALGAAGLSQDLLSSVELLYNSATVGKGDDAPEFAAWLEAEAKEHPLLAPHFGSAGAPPPASPSSQAAATPTGPNLNPPDSGAFTPPGPRGKMSPDDLRAYFATPEFQAMDSDARRARIAELRSEVGR